MSSWYFTRHRGETQLSYIRLAVAFLTLFAFRSELALSAQNLAVAVYGYGAVASIALVLAARTFPTLQRRMQLQALDLICSLFFIYAGSASFAIVLVHYIFIVAGAALRFRWPTILWVSSAAVVTYLYALLSRGVRADSTTMVQLFLFAFIALIAATVMNVQERQRLQLGAVLDLHAGAVDSLQRLLSDCLEQLSAVLSSPRVFFVVSLGEDDMRAGCWVGGQVYNDDDASAWFDLSDESLEHVDFLCNDVSRGVVTTSSGERMRVDEPLARDIAAEHQIESMLLIRFQGSSAHGILIFADRYFDPDDLALGRLASDTFAARLDDFNVATAASRRLVSNERARVARDLHDGLLQSLTGASLQIDVARRRIDDAPEEARQLLREIQDILVVDQHELRFLIDALRHSRRRSNADLNSEVRFNAVAAIVRRQWNADVDLRLPSLRQYLSRNDRREVDRLIREAVFNAAKHAGAKLIVAEGEVEAGFVRLSIRDDGRGFAFRGRYELQELKQMGAGPATLKERVEALGGMLTIDSRDYGSVVEMRIPITGRGASA